MKTLILSFLILLLSFSDISANDFGQLTPVEDPFEFQNEFYPITVGNYWKMAYYTFNSNNETKLKGYYHQTILDYTYQEIYFGDSLYYVPVFREEVKFQTMEVVKTYYYLIKTDQGILISTEEPRRKKFETFLFIPQNSIYDGLSELVTNKKLTRDVKVKTGSWELNCLKIEWFGKGTVSNFLYAEGYGHVLTQHFSIEGAKAEPMSQFILEEFIIK